MRRNLQRSIAAVVLATAGCCYCIPAQGQAVAPPAPPALNGGDWPTERVEMLDGRKYFGLIESEDNAWVNLVQIQRQPGKPMHLVIRPIERRLTTAVFRLDDPQRAELRKRIEQFLNRAPIETGRMDAVRLESVQQDGASYRRYHGKWFSLDSTVDEPTTRRIIVRVEQVFTAYRQVLPPRCAASRPLRLVVFGSPDEYHAYLNRLGLKLDSRACYLQKENLVVAGSEVARFAAELGKVSGQHEQLRRELNDLDQRLKKRLQELARQLQQQGVSKAEIARLIKIENRKGQDQIDRKKKEIGRCDRENEQLFDKVTRQMFTRLYHEAFHAYLENYVYPHDRHDVPRWLNEGLAVLFENGLLESDTLRIDAPNAAALKGLKADLGVKPLELASLLDCGEKRFDDRDYLYAWGLVYYLTFEKSLLDNPALERYVEPSAGDQKPVPRFEKLTGTPLSQFEQQWREYVKKLH